MDIQKLTKVNRIVIAAPQGRSGKTTVTLGLLRALRRRGLRVQPFKKGPDYIDPSWHKAAAGIPCYNLDSYLMEPDQICRSMISRGLKSDISIIEGAMGLFDGLDLAGCSSTAEIAKITETPVVLVLDTTRMTRSAAAIVMGCQHFDPQIQIRGVILNKVARPRHEKILREAIEHFCKVPVLGAIPKDNWLNIPDRHLGLITHGESSNSDSLLDYLADVVESHVDLESLCDLASQVSEIPLIPSAKPSAKTSGTRQAVRIGVFKDKVFSFYYPENLTALTDLGAEIIEIDSLADLYLPPDLDALYIGGGFPEVFASELENNIGLRFSVKMAAESGLPIYAECGGLMYLGRTIKVDGETFSMAGALPLDIVMESKPQGHGYTSLQTLPGNSWFAPDITLKGHEFHNSRIINPDPKIRYAYKLEKGHGIDGTHDGIIYKGILASYNHLHALGTPHWAERLVERAASYSIYKHSELGRVQNNI